MPSDGHFAFSVLIGGQRVPEYHKDGCVYVESDLWTPFSYEQEVKELVNGEVEVQSYPVTPYQLFLQLGPNEEKSAFFIYVDGVLVNKVLMEKGECRLIKGFQEKAGMREMLFALPRFAREKADRLDSERRSKIGKIEVVRKAGKFVKEEYRPISEVTFTQANKKDAHNVTGGRYTMSTTKKGRYLSRQRPYEVKLKKMWQIDRELGRLESQYRMRNSLEDMGIELKPIDWTKVKRRNSIEDTCSTSTEESVHNSDSGVHHYMMTTNVDHIKQQPPEDL